MSAIVYSFVPCCDPTADPIQFNTHGVFLPTVPGTYLYTDLPLNGLEDGQCYSVTETTGGLPNPALPYLNSIAGFELIAGGCEDEQCSCGDQCYILTSCDSFVIYSDSDLALYVDQFVSLVEYPGECFYVELGQPGGCGPSPIAVNVDPDIPCSCPCNCYIITGSGTVSYIACDGTKSTAFAPAQFCSVSYPEITSGIGSLEIFDNGLCDDITGCPEKCFLLTNCDPSITETITSNTFTLLQYALNNQIITISGYEGCWTVEETEVCDCAVPVTIIQSFSSCETCSPPPAYKLINCDNASQIIYTYQDLSAYIGKVLSLDCGGCWIVELLTIPPPSTQVVTVLFEFDTCELCKATYYRLTDCAGFKDEVITTTDLSAYLGDVIQIKFCDDTCWTVNQTDPEPSDGEVTVLQSFGRACQPCLVAIATPKCVVFTNLTNNPVSFGYVTAEGTVIKATLLANESTEKACYLSWDVNQSIQVTEYGDCVDGLCPEVPRPKRKVKPGYSVPVCSTEKYEKITCRASEIYYKMVLEKRYGIGNCCDDLSDKWLLKKEIIDLQGLIDPDYTCTVITSCCNQPINTCGCGCNSTPTIRTCNS